MIGNKTFIEFVEQLEREEDIQLETFKIGEQGHIVTIAPDPKKADKDIAIPVLSPILTRKKSLAEEIAELDVSALNCPVLPRKQDDAAAKTFRYEGYDIITLQKLIEREYTHSGTANGGGSHRLLRPAHRAGRETAVAIRRAGTKGPRVSGNESVR